jgi:hypothetical protein
MELRRRDFTALMLGVAAALSLAGQADAESDPLPSWNAGQAKDALVKFVHATTDAASPNFVPLAERIATFDQGRHAMGRASNPYAARLLLRVAGDATITD